MKRIDADNTPRELESTVDRSEARGPRAPSSGRGTSTSMADVRSKIEPDAAAADVSKEG